MPNAPKTALTFDVYLWNDADPSDPIHHQVVTGLRERMKAKERFKKPVGEVLSAGDEEGIAYLAYLGCQRYGHIEGDMTFDQFVEQIFAVDPEGVDEAMADAAGLTDGDPTDAGKEDSYGGRDD